MWYLDVVITRRYWVYIDHLTRVIECSLLYSTWYKIEIVDYLRLGMAGTSMIYKLWVQVIFWN